MSVRGEMAEELMRLLSTLMKGGYILARYHPTTGRLEPVTAMVLGDPELGAMDAGNVDVEDDLELSVADAFRFGVLRGSSYTAVRMKMTRSRHLHPEIMPRFRTRGTQTLYRVGDLREWQDAYDFRSRQGHHRRKTESAKGVQLDALSVLLGKIRKEEE